MNKWTQKSIALANSNGYLDELNKIYPVDLGRARNLSPQIKSKIRKAFDNKNRLDLIKTLLELSRFPIDDPYLASFRRHPDLLRKNPRTIKRIGDILFSMGLNDILKLSSKPKSASRKFGQVFKNWLRTTKYPFLTSHEIINYRGVAFLDGSDNNLKFFARKFLNLKSLKRRPDFILKLKNKFIIGEAKFLSDYGGTQNNQFDGAMSMAKIKTPETTGIAILDGILWFKGNSYMHKEVKQTKNFVLSALLLENFMKNF